MNLWPTVLFLGCAVPRIDTANILVVLPWPSYSHTNNYMPIFRGLAARGHNVTMFSPFPQKPPLPNLTDIVFPNLKEELFKALPEDLINDDRVWFRLFGLFIKGINWMKVTLNHDLMKALIADTSSKFDLVIVETGFLQEPFVAFGHKYNAPVINLASRFLLPLSAHLSGNQLPISYVPMQVFSFSDHMSFTERAVNMLQYYWEVVVGHLFYLRAQDLQEFMDNAKDGVIYFSFGSYIELSMKSERLQRSLISVLGGLKQKVLMKLEATNPFINSTKPNILVRQWFPQPSILAHPNCKLFITHSGLHGSMEGIYHKVPMLSIPLYVDQKMNAKMLESAGVGYTIQPEDVTEETLQIAINKLLNNQSYKENINRKSAIMKDTPIDPLDNVLYWIEYVIRHRGAPHLRPAVLDLHWYQYLMLDVIALYLLILVIMIYVIKTVLTLLWRCLRCTIFRGKGSNLKSKRD
ncbi:UDP-glycosyltransferase UGT4-like isoform X2 [Rhodnius prolixus]|uniref:UDP-glycosyltransferase UGT4-like isoform X2 n=1 Tax=Rhodnius prolixus TaxID=13249 RepID=UPI003D18D215